MAVEFFHEQILIILERGSEIIKNLHTKNEHSRCEDCALGCLHSKPPCSDHATYARQSHWTIKYKQVTYIYFKAKQCCLITEYALTPLKNSFFSRTIPMWNSLPSSVSHPRPLRCSREFRILRYRDMHFSMPPLSFL